MCSFRESVLFFSDISSSLCFVNIAPFTRATESCSFCCEQPMKRSMNKVVLFKIKMDNYILNRFAYLLATLNEAFKLETGISNETSFFLLFL